MPVQISGNPASSRLGVASLAAPTLETLGGQDRQGVVEASAIALARAVELTGVRLPAALSEREQQALALVASGRGDREIGMLMNVSAATAHFHVEQAKRKLGAITRAQAVAIAVSRNLIVSG